MVARFAELLQGACTWVCRAARTDSRRPSLVAVAAGFLALQFLPAGTPRQRVLVTNPGGCVEHAFSLSVDDPQLQALRQAAAARPDYRKRADDYYRAQWDMTTAEFYAVQSEASDTAAIAESPLAAPGTVTQASFAAPAVPAERRDWAEFWERLRETSAAKLRSLDPAPRVEPTLARLQFGELRRGPLPPSSVFAALCVAAVGFVAARRWGCETPQRRILLRARQRLVVPRRWYRQRRSISDLTAALTRGRIIECAAVATVAMLLLGRCLGA